MIPILNFKRIDKQGYDQRKKEKINMHYQFSIAYDPEEQCPSCPHNFNRTIHNYRYGVDTKKTYFKIGEGDRYSRDTVHSKCLLPAIKAARARLYIDESKELYARLLIFRLQARYCIVI